MTTDKPARDGPSKDTERRASQGIREHCVSDTLGGGERDIDGDGDGDGNTDKLAERLRDGAAENDGDAVDDALASKLLLAVALALRESDADEDTLAERQTASAVAVQLLAYPTRQTEQGVHAVAP